MEEDKTFKLEEGPCFACQSGLGNNPTECQHCQAAILKLFELHLVRLVLFLWEEIFPQEEVACITVDFSLEALEKKAILRKAHMQQ